ncbi:MAG TPA: AAA family ATPase [Ohtaekwangia sp.]|uniref:AAA family ATPase n=1 Tax=Ohtaekwangia sp. TaxID=2066019 RepID=UPI002F9211A1
MYKVKQYIDQVGRADADTQKRFAMVEKLSRGFTVENRTALEMDRLLTEQFELERTVPKTPEQTARLKPVAAKPKIDRNPAEPAKVRSTEEIFQELFETLKKQPQGNVDADSIRQLLQDELQAWKIGYDNLDRDVRQMLSNKEQTIRFELPPTPTTAFKKPSIKSFQEIVDDILLGNNVMLIGGAGTGKTYLAENLIAKIALGRKHITINCSQWTSPTEIIGGQTMDGYVEGKLIEAWVNGYVLVLDELPKIDPNTAGLFNDALAKTKVSNAVIFNARKESFTKHEHFACIATGNIYPDKESVSYGANNKQDLSLLDRFAGSVYFIEKNPVIEREILQNDMVWSICDRLRSAIEELKYEAQISLRFMLNARDSYNLEMHRNKTKGKDGVKPSEGKTFRSSVDNYLSTFTEIQQKNLKEKIRYNELFDQFEYRDFDTTKPAY